MPASENNYITITLLNKKDIPSFLELYANISGLSGSMLLDTSGSTKSDGRFNIMLWEPVSSVVAKAGTVSLVDNRLGTRVDVNMRPFEATNTYLHAAVSNYQLSPCSESYADILPFIIGVAGFAGYDTGRFYESLPTVSLDCYDTPDYCVSLYTQSIIEDTKTGSIYFCRVGDYSLPAFLLDKTTKQEPLSLTSTFESNLSKQDYTAALNKINAYLRAGDCYQVNMAQRFSATFKGDPWHAYLMLRDENIAPFSAYVKHQHGAILSISPERFISVKNNIVETKPIKGTRPRFDDPVEDTRSAENLLAAEKDRAENLMIVDLLRNDISKHCKPHSVNVPALFALESYQAVHHMVSTIVGELNEGVTPLDLLAASFPGGSITGAPKIRAMEVIDELEPHRRNIYCGSIFYMGFREDMDSSICIRTLLVENDTMHCWAGGGIVLDSNANDEYQETLDKVSKIIPSLEKAFGYSNG